MHPIRTANPRTMTSRSIGSIISPSCRTRYQIATPTPWHRLVPSLSRVPATILYRPLAWRAGSRGTFRSPSRPTSESPLSPEVLERRGAPVACIWSCAGSIGGRASPGCAACRACTGKAKRPRSPTRLISRLTASGVNGRRARWANTKNFQSAAAAVGQSNARAIGRRAGHRRSRVAAIAQEIAAIYARATGVRDRRRYRRGLVGVNAPPKGVFSRRHSRENFWSMPCPRQQTLAHGLGDGLGHIARP
jgi:hypothetical protein